MFFIQKKIWLMFVVFFFQNVGPPNEKIRVFGFGGPNPETTERAPVEQTERVPPRTGGIRRRTSSSRTRNLPLETPAPRLSFVNQAPYTFVNPNGTPNVVAENNEQVTVVNSVPIGTLSINDRYNQVIYPNAPGTSAAPTFPYLPNSPNPILIQPVLSSTAQPPQSYIRSNNCYAGTSLRNIPPLPSFRDPATNPFLISPSPQQRNTISNVPLSGSNVVPPVPSCVSFGSSHQVGVNIPSTSRGPLFPPFTPSSDFPQSNTPLDRDEIRRERDRKRKQEFRKNETPEMKRVRQEKAKAASLKRRAAETAQERNIRQSSDAISHRASRANATQDQIANRLQRDAAAHRDSRGNETQEQINNRLQRDAAAHRNSRANETQEQTSDRLQRNAAAHRDSRANETQEQTSDRRQLDAAGHRDSRANASQEQTSNRHQRDAAAHRDSRTDQDPQRLEAIREANRSSHRRRREQMSIEERNEHNARRRNVYQMRMEERRNRSIYIAMENVIPDLHYLGQLIVECVPCGALYFPDEATEGPGGDFEPCCCHGRVSMAPFRDYPLLLQELMTRVHEESSNFHANIRQFNSALAMASLDAKLSTPPGRGPSVFRVHGQVVHNVSPAMPRNGQPRSYGQLYFIDTAQAIDERMGKRANQKCSNTLMHSLSNLMMQINRLAQAYKMLSTVYHEEIAKAIAENAPLPQMKMMFYTDKTKDQRRYNSPVSNEVAAVYVGPDGEVPTPRQFTIFLQAGGFETLEVKNPKLDPLSYPLFWPTGSDSWHPGLKKDPVSGGVQTRLTQCDYYSFLLSIRRQFNPIHYSGKLLQQFAVDVWIRMEQNRLEWARNNQEQLRADLFQNLSDFVDDGHGGLAGTRVLLPSSHVGSPRNFSKAYYDTMSMVAKYGKPDLFLTFTCNPKWREIVENLYPGQEPSDRPDLVARVFVLKWKELMKDVVENRIFGHVVSFAYTVEWQKRGLPHCHLLITLAAAAKLDSKEKVDKAISAEIPDQEEESVLYEVVKKHMLHRRCGDTDPTAPCMKEGKCSKHFPKKFCEETNMDGTGYPEYRRRNNGRTITIQSGTHTQIYDNRHVVPFNKWLSCKFGCHVNVEVCCLLHACKYLYKYCFKGSDKASMELRHQRKEIGRPVDEITEYLDGRYLCAPEAIHRIFGNKVQERSHSIENLQVHIPDNQRVTFAPGEEREALNRAENRNTTLTAFFALNQRWHEKEERGESLGPMDPRTLLYAQIPEHFTFKKVGTEYIWDTRGGGGNKKIGRMHGASIKDRERFSLRQLLLKRKGPRSFEELKTLNGHTFASFEGAATAMGLLNSDDSFAQTMDEACQCHMPFQLRRLFASLFLFEVPHKEKALELWQKYSQDLSEDYVHRGRNALESAALAWFDIEEMVGLQNLELRDFIPPPLPQRPADIDEDDGVDHRAVGAERRLKLNREQEHVVAQILSGTKLAYLDGAGGCGKTFVYETLFHILKGQGKWVVSAAWTGIASSLLPEGRTVCSLFKLNSNDENRSSNVKPNSREGADLRKIDTIIIDEVSMLSIYNLDAIDKCLKDVCNTTEPFGGKRILLGGDFRQTLPIPSKHSGQQPFDICLKNSELFQLFTRFQLKTNMRANTETVEWKELLLSVGNGTAAQDEDECISLPEDIKSNGDLIAEIYEGIYDDPEHLQARAILTCRNNRVDAINKDVLELMNGTTHTYYSCDTQELDNESDQLEVSTEFMNDQTPAGFPLHALHLKVGCVVMLIRNLNIRSGLCNGTRLQVTNLGRHLITAKFISGARKGQPVWIPRIDISSSNSALSFKMRRTQFPLRLAFAMTINKSQGQSLERVGIDLEDDVFAHGMLYVGLSRSTTKSGIKVLTKEHNSRARNVVDTRVLE